MVGAGLALADALVLEAGQGRQDVDRRPDALLVKLAAQDDLAFGDVAGQVGDRMGLVVIRHGQDRHQGDRAGFALLAAGAFVHGRQVGVEITRIAAAARHFLAGGGDFAQRFGIVGDVGHDDQNVHVQAKGQVFGGRQGHARGGDAFDGRVVGQVHEQDRAVDGAGPAEIADEIVGFLEGDAHGGEDDGEIAGPVADLGLAGDLGSQLGMRQAGCREDRQLLAADQGVQAIDGRDAGLDEFVRDSRGRPDSSAGR